MMFNVVRIGWLLAVLLGAVFVVLAPSGCGDVQLAMMPDGMAGAAGATLEGGAAGATGSAGDVGGGGIGGMAGEGGAAGAPACVPDACNYCTENVLVPKPDGTRCGPGLCDDVLPFVGQGGCVSKNQTCQAGVCVTTTVDCCRKCPTPGPQSRCTADAPEDPSVPSFCAACVF